MVLIQHQEGGLQRHPSKRKVDKITRAPWRARRRKALKKTSAEKAHLKAKRKHDRDDFQNALQEASAAVTQLAQDLHERFPSHSVEHYGHLLMQHTSRPKGQRAASRWNAFLSKQLREVNDALPEGAPRQRATAAFVREASILWEGMSKAQRVAETDETLLELKERREKKTFSMQQVPLSAFNDARTTLAAVENELTALHSRTGTEAILFAVRSKTEHYNKPYVFCSNARMSEFMEVVTKASVQDLALRMEGYCVAGVQGVVSTYRGDMLDLKKKTSGLIFSKLQHKARGTISRMWYNNFDTQITNKYGIIIENWPLAKFCCPSDVGSRPELEVLYRAWESGTTRFHVMPDAEWEEWQEARFQAQMRVMEGEDLEEEEASTTHENSAPSHASASSPSPTVSPPSNSTTSPGDSAVDSAGTMVHDKRPNASEETGPSQSKRARRDPLAYNAVNVVSGPNGSSLAVTKKPRKTRSDKGVKRGPKAKARSQTTSSTSAQPTANTADVTAPVVTSGPVSPPVVM
ncbi:hypothetical protein B0H21DRAFT_699888 [Amylocystis lapponica]|nr:hypothetical protein B0H21DRAFT_699888 [Amylocystis lapponica]